MMKSFSIATKVSLAIALLVTVSLGTLSLLAVMASRRSLREQVQSANLTAATLEKDALLVLNGLARSITTLRDLDELVLLVARAAVDLLKVTSSLLWLAEGTELRPAGWSGLEEPVARALGLSLSAQLVERAVVRRTVDIPSLFATSTRSHDLGRIGHWLAVSLVTGNRLVGVLAVVNRSPREFGGMDERLLTILADHAAIAIENGRLYRQLRDRLEDLERAQERLLQTEKVAAMGQLLAGVAHELNNPLSVMLGHTALLQQATGTGPLAGRAGKIAVAGQRCARIVKNFLALARQRPPERHPVDVNQLVREAVELLMYSLRVDNVAVAFELAEGLPVIWGDPHQLHQVVVNLVTNAHHAMRETEPPRRLVITTRVDPARRRVHLEVADTGPGIPRDIQARIFEPFFTTKAPGQGTGLGLSLCRGIVESHGGGLDVESEPGRGALFRIELPVTAAGPAAAEVPAAKNSASGSRKAILVIDDEPEVVGVLADLLAADGHQVETADNGRVGLEKLQARSYDLILSDVRMPELDGPELYREIERRMPDVRRRFVFMTGDELSAQTRAFLEETGVRCLSKPFDLGDVRRVVAVDPDSP